MWKDLPQGKPEAQAAYQDNYHGGKDQFGREVANPAGIDLADGTFWDGLKLTTNSWVTATCLWTGSGPVGTVRTAAANGTVNVRTGANSSSTQVGSGRELRAGPRHVPADGRVGLRHAGHLEHLVPHRDGQVRRQGVRRGRQRRDYRA